MCIRYRKKVQEVGQINHWRPWSHTQKNHKKKGFFCECGIFHAVGASTLSRADVWRSNMTFSTMVNSTVSSIYLYDEQNTVVGVILICTHVSTQYTREYREHLDTSNDLTRALDWVLHSQHTPRGITLVSLPFSPPYARAGTSWVREGIGTTPWIFGGHR